MASNEKCAFSLPNNPKDIICDHVSDALKNLLDLARNYKDNLNVFQWVLIVRLLLQFCFYFAMKETSFFLFLVKTKLIFSI